MLPKQVQRRVSFGKEITVIERDISHISPSSASGESTFEVLSSPNVSMSSSSLSSSIEDSKTEAKTKAKIDSKAKSNHETEKSDASTKNSGASSDTKNKKHVRRKVLIHYNTSSTIDHTGKVPARPALKHANTKQLPTDTLTDQDGANDKENVGIANAKARAPIKLIQAKKKKSKVVEVVAKIRRSLRI